MNSNKNIIFLGMMGSGKSSIGSLVSKKLDIPFIDIDKEIFNNHQDPLALFYGHYNEKGYKLIAEHILSQKLQ